MDMEHQITANFLFMKAYDAIMFMRDEKIHEDSELKIKENMIKAKYAKQFLNLIDIWIEENDKCQIY